MLPLPKKVAALGLAVVLGAVVTAVALSYGDGLEGGVPITIDSARSGLVLEPGAMVKMHDVQVGTVTAVAQHDSGAVISVRLDPSAAGQIPAGVGADIRATTLFGAKYVTLTDPPRPTAERIAAGTTIRAGSVTVEVDTLFESLNDLLGAVDPAKLNSLLTALSDGLDGRGGELGTTLQQANSFLEPVAERTPELQHDVTQTAAVAGIYRDAADDVMTDLRNLTTTARTLSQRRTQFDALLLSVIGLAGQGTPLLTDNTPALTATMSLLRPTAGLLHEYSGGITCFLQGADQTRRMAEPVSGGNGATMKLNSTFLLGVEPYAYPTDLPVVRARGGPRCGGLPKLSMDQVPAPYVVADTGADPFAGVPAGPQVRPDTLLTNPLGTPTPAAPPAPGGHR
ncbi:MCE family protein [Speluncibacter jeojiensis]|uniref:MCE family protein n=1 Tax=Speluncibacter jeojiensis TaxID=2710754 RepID=A0A9X4M1V5_9ACTN|nr:MCE family protein [Corynebacteriales bacterium D3-21]